MLTWPSVGKRANTWRDGREFFHAVPGPINNLWRAIPAGTTPTRTAVEDLTRLKRAARPRLPLVAMVEALSSSRIAGIQTDAAQIALARSGARQNAAALQVVRCMEAAGLELDRFERITMDYVVGLHAALGGRDDPANAGRFREVWVWIGGASPVTAGFVPPPQEHVVPLMEDLVRFMVRTQVDPIVHAALTHGQFETIYPFTDGTGRVGRALIADQLRTTAPISLGLLQKREDYFEALAAYRAGLPESLIELLSDAVRVAVQVPAQLPSADDVREQVLGAVERKTAGARHLAALCADHLVITAKMLTDRGVTNGAAYRLLARLVDAGVLTRHRGAVPGVDAWTVGPWCDGVDALIQAAERPATQSG